MTNNILLYVTQSSIDKFNSKFGKMEEFHLYKVLFLVQQELFKYDIDFKLPYYWYFHGPLLNVQGFYYQTGVSFDKFSPNWKQHPPKYVINPQICVGDFPNKKIVDDVINLIIDTIENEAIEEYLKREVYKYAPQSFRRSFKKFESFLDLGDYGKAKEFFFKLIAEFPRDESLKIYDLFLEWETVVDLAFEMEKYSFIEDINKPFWRAYCHNFSVVDYKNLNDDQLQRLKQTAEVNYPTEE